MKGSAQKFFNKATANNQNPRVINIDKIRRCKYLNNCVEQEHRNIKRRIAIDTGFKEFESAQRTLAGIEVVSIIRKNQIVDSKKSYFKTFLSFSHNL
jgi:putative transposase